MKIFRIVILIALCLFAVLLVINIPFLLVTCNTDLSGLCMYYLLYILCVPLSIYLICELIVWYVNGRKKSPQHEQTVLLLYIRRTGLWTGVLLMLSVCFFWYVNRFLVVTVVNESNHPITNIKVLACKLSIYDKRSTENYLLLKDFKRINIGALQTAITEAYSHAGEYKSPNVLVLQISGNGKIVKKQLRGFSAPHPDFRKIVIKIKDARIYYRTYFPDSGEWKLVN